MALFYYIAKTKDGKTIKQVEDVSSKEEIIGRLREKGLFIVSLREFERRRGGGLLKKRKKHAGVKLLDLTFFARNLATTISSGVPLLRSLEIISVQTESDKLSKVLTNIIQEIKRGLSLSESVQKHPNIFSSFWLGLIEVGETSGNLTFVLEKLADYLELRLDFERKIKSALIYPIILVIAAFIAMFIFFKMILPKFTVIFKQFDIELPFLTELLFNTSKLVNEHFLLIILFTGGCIAGIWFGLKHPLMRRIIDKVVLFIPILSGVTTVSYLERFSSTIYILLESGVPIVYSLEIVAKSIGNSVVERDILFIKENVKKGKTLSGELQKIPIFPPLVTEIARVGEEAGNLPEMFRKVSVHYQKEVSTKIERLIAAFEPIMILLMGVVIGGIVVSLFLPLFKVATLGGG